MTKRQLIDEILRINRSASPRFLAEFQDRDLSEYLAHLLAVRGPKPQGDPWWPQRHLTDRPATPASAPKDAEGRLREADDEPAAPADEAFLDSDPDALADPARQAVLAGAARDAAPARGRRRPRAKQTSERWLF